LQPARFSYDPGIEFKIIGLGLGVSDVAGEDFYVRTQRPVGANVAKDPRWPTDGRQLLRDNWLMSSPKDEPHLQLREPSRPRLRRLEQTHRSTLAHHMTISLLEWANRF
jgi:hypothetical protein